MRQRRSCAAMRRPRNLPAKAETAATRAPSALTGGRNAMITTKNYGLLALSLTCLAFGANSAAAQGAAASYPNRPVHWIVSYPPGGSTDITARLFGQYLSEKLGQQFIVENRPGGGNNIGTEQALKAAPDGYTVYLVNPANAINATLYEKLNFN